MHHIVLLNIIWSYLILLNLHFIRTYWGKCPRPNSQTCPSFHRAGMISLHPPVPFSFLSFFLPSFLPSSLTYFIGFNPSFLDFPPSLTSLLPPFLAWLPSFLDFPPSFLPCLSSSLPCLTSFLPSFLPWLSSSASSLGFLPSSLFAVLPCILFNFIHFIFASHWRTYLLHFLSSILLYFAIDVVIFWWRLSEVSCGYN